MVALVPPGTAAGEERVHEDVGVDAASEAGVTGPARVSRRARVGTAKAVRKGGTSGSLWGPIQARC